MTRRPDPSGGRGRGDFAEGRQVRGVLVGQAEAALGVDVGDAVDRELELGAVGCAEDGGECEGGDGRQGRGFSIGRCRRGGFERAVGGRIVLADDDWSRRRRRRRHHGSEG
jgi:hypothetical protein